MKQTQYTRNKVGYFIGFIILFLTVFVLSFWVGKYPVSPAQLFEVLFQKITGSVTEENRNIELVIFNIRLPRILAGALVGAGLSSAGAGYQGVFKNPLVSPDLLGASSGAGFGAAFCLLFAMGSWAVTIGAFSMGLLAVLLVYVIGLRANQNSVLSIILAGVMISSLFSAATSFIKLVADPNDTLPAITYWLMGSLSNMSMSKVTFVIPPIFLGLLILIILRWKINLLTMGDEEAQSMGTNVKKVRAFTILAATLITAACVSISGVIGWIGLVIPHLARILVGNDYRALLPASMLLGASFLMVVDDVSRILTTAEIPIGILTAFIGAPFFLYLILKKGKGV